MPNLAPARCHCIIHAERSGVLPRMGVVLLAFFAATYLSSLNRAMMRCPCSMPFGSAQAPSALSHRCRGRIGSPAMGSSGFMLFSLSNNVESFMAKTYAQISETLPPKLRVMEFQPSNADVVYQMLALGGGQGSIVSFTAAGFGINPRIEDGLWARDAFVQMPTKLVEWDVGRVLRIEEDSHDVVVISSQGILALGEDGFFQAVQEAARILTPMGKLILNFNKRDEEEVGGIDLPSSIEKFQFERQYFGTGEAAGITVTSYTVKAPPRIRRRRRKVPRNAPDTAPEAES